MLVWFGEWKASSSNSGFLTRPPPTSSVCPLISWPAAVIGKSVLDCCASPFALIGFDWESAYIKASENGDKIKQIWPLKAIFLFFFWSGDFEEVTGRKTEIIGHERQWEGGEALSTLSAALSLRSSSFHRRFFNRPAVITDFRGKYLRG